MNIYILFIVLILIYTYITYYAVRKTREGIWNRKTMDLLGLRRPPPPPPVPRTPVLIRSGLPVVDVTQRNTKNLIEQHNNTVVISSSYSTKDRALVRFGDIVNLNLIDGYTKKALPLLRIVDPTDITLKGGVIIAHQHVAFVSANDPTKVLMMNDRRLVIADLALQSTTPKFRIRPGFVNGNVKGKEPLRYGDKVSLSNDNSAYNQCGWFGCRVLYPETGYFRHGGKIQSSVPQMTIKQDPKLLSKQDDYVSEFTKGNKSISWKTSADYRDSTFGRFIYRGTSITSTTPGLNIRGDYLDVKFPTPIYLQNIVIKINDMNSQPTLMTLMGKYGNMWKTLRTLFVGENPVFVNESTDTYRIVVSEVYNAKYADLSTIKMFGTDALASIEDDPIVQDLKLWKDGFRGSRNNTYPEWIIPVAIGSVFVATAARVVTATP